MIITSCKTWRPGGCARAAGEFNVCTLKQKIIGYTNLGSKSISSNVYGSVGPHI